MDARVVVVGVGLIGGSIGLALRQTATTVVGCDASAEALRRASELGAIDEASSLPEAVAGGGVVVVATPVAQILPTVATVAAHAPDGTVVTDVGSTKQTIVAEAEGLLAPTRAFVGGHPMAGTEGEGVEAARADLFREALWILTPTSATDPEAFRRANALVAATGARAMALDPAVHDRLVALVSHLPYALATALMSLAGREGDERVFRAAAGAFRDVTRTAGTNPGIWRDILSTNRDAVLDELDSFGRELGAFASALRDRDWDRVDGLIAEARRARERFPLKGERGPAAPVLLDVPVPDRTGVLAEITTAIGDVGVNIEDIWMDHTPSGGAVHLLVDGEDAAERSERALGERGFRVVRIQGAV